MSGDLNFRPSYISLLSGGLDSVVNLHRACLEGEVKLALTFDYGQRAAQSEIRAARFFCEKLRVQHKVIDLKWLGELTHTALVSRDQNIPTLKNLDDMTEANASAKAVWVPNRNGVFLNIAASFAESLSADFVVPGFNREEAATFPDNSEEFIKATNESFSLSTMSQVKVYCFTTNLNKHDMVAEAYRLGVDMKHLWSCYRGEAFPCGECESCQRSNRAIRELSLS